MEIEAAAAPLSAYNVEVTALLSPYDQRDCKTDSAASFTQYQPALCTYSLNLSSML